MASDTRKPGGYLLLLGLAGATLGAGLVQVHRAITGSDWWTHALMALALAFTSAYLWVLAQDRKAALAAAAAAAPEGVDPATRDSRTYVR